MKEPKEHPEHGIPGPAEPFAGWIGDMPSEVNTWEEEDED